MKNIILIVIVAFVCQVVSLHANIKVNAGISYLPFDPADLIQLESSKSEKAPFPLKTVDSYPSQLLNSLEINYFSDQFELGLIFSKYSTGSRQDYTDYSGSYRLDNIIDYRQVGVDFYYFSRKIEEIDPCFAIVLGFELGMSYDNYSSTTKILLKSGDSLISNETSINRPYTKPKIGGLFKYKYFTISAFIGYHWELQEKKYGNFTGITYNLSAGFFFPLF